MEEHSKHAEKRDEDACKAQRNYEREEENIKRKVKKLAKMERELRTLNEERNKVLTNFDRKVNEEVKEDKEEELMRKILWLLVCSNDDATQPSSSSPCGRDIVVQHGDCIEAHMQYPDLAK